MHGCSASGLVGTHLARPNCGSVPHPKSAEARLRKANGRHFSTRRIDHESRCNDYANTASRRPIALTSHCSLASSMHSAAAMETPRTTAKQQVVDRIPARIKHIQFGI